MIRNAGHDQQILFLSPPWPQLPGCQPATDWTALYQGMSKVKNGSSFPSLFLTQKVSAFKLFPPSLLFIASVFTAYYLPRHGRGVGVMASWAMCCKMIRMLCSGHYYLWSRFVTYLLRFYWRLVKTGTWQRHGAIIVTYHSAQTWQLSDHAALFDVVNNWVSR